MSDDDLKAEMHKLNEDARRLLSYLHAGYLKHSNILFTVGPNEETTKDTGLDGQPYEHAAKRLVTKGLAKWMGTGHHLRMTPTGLRVAEDDDSLDYELPLPRSKRQASSEADDPETIMPARSTGMHIFVSHSADDAGLAKGLIALIEAGLEVPTGAIRCTSVDGYKLDGGDNAPEVLRENIEECAVVLGILTKASASSSYVLMELGAAWAFKKRAIPLIGPGATFGDLPGPFRDIHALKMAHDPDMAGLIGTIARETHLTETKNLPKIQAALKTLGRALAESIGATGVSTTDPVKSENRPPDGQPTSPSAVGPNLMAARKLQAIERLSKAADTLTRTVMNTMGRGTNGAPFGLCPNMVPYGHLIQETRNYYGTEFHGELMAFSSCAQKVYSELASLQDEDFHRIPTLHGQVEAGRNRLTEAMRRELSSA